jgi:RNA polymerase sigma-70 factor (ECF subfamily)
MCASDGSEDPIRQAVSGDMVALERLLLRHHNLVAAHIAKALREPLKSTSVEDLLQETFVQAIRDIGSCHAESEQSFCGWLLTIADHRMHVLSRAMDCKKRGGGRQPVHVAATCRDSVGATLLEVLAGKDETPSGVAGRHEALAAVQAGVAALPQDQREAVRLHFIEQRTLDETASNMGRSPAAVRGLLHRAKDGLRATLRRSSLWLAKR